MRILQFIETGGPGGAETVFARLSAALHARGHEVSCVIGDGSWLPDEMRRRALAYQLYETQGAFDLAAIARLRSLIRRERIDVVHAHLFEGAVYASVAARLERVPVIVTLHGLVDVRQGGTRGYLKRWILRAVAQQLVAVSESLRTGLASSFGLSPQAIAVIYNGSPTTPGAARSSSAAPRAADAPMKRVVALGNIRRPKDYPTMIRAFARIRQRFEGAILEIGGETDGGVIAEELASLTASLNLGASVQFRGFVKDPATFLAGADCYLLTSTTEGFSLATVEAMLAQVPVVVTASGGPQEIVVDGDTGYIVPVGDPERIAEAVCRILEDTALATRLTRAAKVDALSRFTESTMVRQYEALYDRLITRGAARLRSP